MRKKSIFKGTQFYECAHCDRICVYKGDKNKCENCKRAL